ncbi:CCN family member 3 [Bombina bombina]|uniref:CCN family member 3 n=1 Tax=Bombina bombina TaxID=8345 RepID=UPI00235A6322|nr:CCN family member 3 [Bombina bombina]
MIWKTNLVLALCTLCFMDKVISQHCPSQCGQCPEEPPNCSSSVPVVLDGCACCPVCARQQGESCSQVYPCQEDKGLFCDFSADSRTDVGTCMVLEGNNCVFDGNVYHDGETFQPSCKYHCTCQDGQIGCVPRCNLDLLLPGPECPFPRKVKVPGECCEKWVCDSKDEVALGGFAMAAYRQEATLGIDNSYMGENCIEQTTEWSACSKTCGMGHSSRVTNRNRRCEMQKQVRLCMVRPCEEQNARPVEKQGKKCVRVQKSSKAIHLEYKNCTSIHTYKPKFCGICSDGRCCTPHSTRTTQVEFHCPHEKLIKRPVMMINTCVCHHNCPQDTSLLQVENAKFPGLKKLKMQKSVYGV